MELIERLRKHFEFLLQPNYGYREIKVRQSKADREQFPVLLYANDTTAIHIHFEARESWMIARFYPLEDGEVTEAAREGLTRGYALPHIIALEKPELELGPMEYDPGVSPERNLDDYIEFHAKSVRRYAKDFLRGDFSRGPQVDAVAEKWLKLRLENLERPLEKVPKPATPARKSKAKKSPSAPTARAPSRPRKS